MLIEMGANHYGKGRVHVARVIRHAEYDDYRNVTVDVMLQGDFGEAFLGTSNENVVPTDTMKNTVWAFAAKHLTSSIEDFGLALAHHFVQDFAQVMAADIAIEENPWQRITYQEHPHPHAFQGAGPELRTTLVQADGDETRITSGLSGLPILKTHGSAFETFTHDKYTTLWEAPDRLLATEITASWLYAAEAAALPLDFDATWQDVRRILIDTFVALDSHSVQHSLYRMGSEVLRAYKTVAELTLSLPNKHHYEVDLRPFGIRSDEVFFPVEDPHGTIEGTVRRVQAPIEKRRTPVQTGQ